MFRRRQVLRSTTAVAVVATFPATLLATVDGALAGMDDKVRHTDAEWRKLLTPEQYEVLRHDGTERPFTSTLLHEEGEGFFACAGCDLPLFAGEMLFDSGTGWPSFWQPIENAVIEKADTSLGMQRTAVICRRCEGHLGHVFNDGPEPTGLRYCINGVALKFVAGGI